MASAKSYPMTTNYRHLINDPTSTRSPPRSTTTKPELEFDESDIWGGSTRSDSPDSRPTWRQPRRTVAVRPSVSRRCVGGRGDAASLPVNIPDWSKILRQEYSNFGGNDGRRNGGDEEEEEEEEWVPPHEYLARTRMASFSVHEGIGRTLKGRDLSKVRNAIWEKTGFQD